MENGRRAKVELTYMDEQNRPCQQVRKAVSPTGKDMIYRTEYDEDSRTVRRWLPISGEGAHPVEEETFRSMAMEQYVDAKPYSSTGKEICSNGRTVCSGMAGETYQAHPTMIEYDVNSTDIPRFEITDNGIERDGAYAAGTLRTTKTTDPDGKQNTVFTDVLGRKIVQRQGEDYDTYYLYDDMGRLRYVLPPAVSKQLNNMQAVRDSDLLLRQYAYIYRYDKCGNVTSKHIPGVEDIRMVYDEAGRMVLRQDGNQRGRGNYWTVIGYDMYGRAADTDQVPTE